MTSRVSYVTHSLRKEEGMTAIEYGLLATMIAVAIIFAAQLVGTNLSGIFNNIAGQLTHL